MLAWLLTTFLIILRFDGSLRRPYDQGFDTDPLTSYAACAAALLDDDERIIAFGGRRLDCGIKSAEAEYGGLLFGLEELVRRCNIGDSNDPSSVLIQGDCKTVIQQVQGRAKPRILQNQHGKATSLLYQLPCPVKLEHVPRERNRLCDFVAGAIVLQSIQSAYQDTWKSLLDIEEDGETAHINEHAKFYQRRDRLYNFWNDHSSRIPYSRRPLFYRRMAAMAAKRNDSIALAWISAGMTSELNTVWKKARDIRSSTRDELMVEAVMFRLIALELAGHHKKAEMLRRQQRLLLYSHAPGAKRVRARLEGSMTIDLMDEELLNFVGVHSDTFAPWNEGAECAVSQKFLEDFLGVPVDAHIIQESFWFDGRT